MKFIPYSNGLHKLKVKKKRDPWKAIEYIIFSMIIIIAFGAIGQVGITKFNAENTKSRDMYVRIDNNKYYYTSRGKGNVTVVMDSALGSGKEEWNSVMKSLGVDYTGSTFTYDRSGYGFNDYEEQTIEQQARNLRLLLKKTGQTSPFILVGDEYGCLVLSAFASIYPDEVAGMILVNPINENYLKDKDYIEKYKRQSLSRYLQHKGSYLSITAILNGFDLLKNPSGLFDGYSELDIKDFNSNKRESAYNSAYYNELMNIINFEKDNKITQTKGLLDDKFVTIISNTDNFGAKQEELSYLSNGENVNIVQVSSDKDIITSDKSDIIADSIKNMIKRYDILHKKK